MVTLRMVGSMGTMPEVSRRRGGGLLKKNFKKESRRVDLSGKEAV